MILALSVLVCWCDFLLRHILADIYDEITVGQLALAVVFGGVMALPISLPVLIHCLNDPSIKQARDLEAQSMTICNDCAVNAGATWPKDRQVTWWMGICPFCLQSTELTDSAHWRRPDKKITTGDMGAGDMTREPLQIERQ